MLTFSEPPSFTFNLKIQNSTVNLRGLTKCAPFWLRVGTPSSCSLAWETCVYVFWRITLDWHDMFHDFLLAQLLFVWPEMFHTTITSLHQHESCLNLPNLPPTPDFWGHQKVSYWNPHQHIKVDSGWPTPFQQASWMVCCQRCNSLCCICWCGVNPLKPLMPPLVVAQGTACALALEIWNDRKPGTGVPKILVLCMVSKVKDRLYVIDIYTM